MQNQKSISAFYDNIASDYDTMTDFENRLGREAAVFRPIIDRFAIQTALDAGAGTGFHSLVLSKLGVNVTAVDISAEMIRKLKENSEKFRLPADAVESDFENLTGHISATFDAVFCLGNSLVHVLTEDALLKSISNFHSLLKPGGVLVIQILNYDRIMKERERVQSIRKAGKTTFIRFYDYCENRLFFNILTVKETDGKTDHTINTVELRPLLKEQTSIYLERVGFISTEHYGSLRFESYDQNKSSNLVMVVIK